MLKLFFVESKWVFALNLFIKWVFFENFSEWVIFSAKVSFRSERLFCQFQVWWWALCVPLNPWTSGPSEVLSELVFTSFCSHPYSQISTKLKRARKYTFAKREKTERTKGLLNFRWYGRRLKISSKRLWRRHATGIFILFRISLISHIWNSNRMHKPVKIYLNILRSLLPSHFVLIVSKIS